MPIGDEMGKDHLAALRAQLVVVVHFQHGMMQFVRTITASPNVLTRLFGFLHVRTTDVFGFIVRNRLMLLCDVVRSSVYIGVVRTLVKGVELGHGVDCCNCITVDGDESEDFWTERWNGIGLKPAMQSCGTGSRKMQFLQLKKCWRTCLRLETEFRTTTTEFVLRVCDSSTLFLRSPVYYSGRKRTQRAKGQTGHISTLM